jgi:adenosylhomocysteine nucleosidase
MTIGVISAMDSEHRQLAERLQEKKVADYGNLHYVEGMLGSNRVILTQCGIGKVNAAVGATELIRRFAPDCIVSTGVAGGIDACLKVTDVVVSESLAYHDVWCGEGNEYGQVQGLPAVYKGCAPLLEHALSLNKTGLESRIHSGLICTGDRFITNRTELDVIKRRFPAGLAVDMRRPAICTAFLSSASVSSAIRRAWKTTLRNMPIFGVRWRNVLSLRHGLSFPPCPTTYNS